MSVLSWIDLSLGCPGVEMICAVVKVTIGEIGVVESPQSKPRK